MEKLLPSVRASGGTPAGMPDFKPRVGRPKLRPSPPPLFQVWVDVKGRGLIPIGPKCPSGVADSLAAEIRRQILLGRERLWSAPYVVPCGGPSCG